MYVSHSLLAGGFCATFGFNTRYFAISRERRSEAAHVRYSEVLSSLFIFHLNDDSMEQPEYSYIFRMIQRPWKLWSHMMTFKLGRQETTSSCYSRLLT